MSVRISGSPLRPAEHIAVRRRYVRFTIDYWHAVQAGDDARTGAT